MTLSFRYTIQHREQAFTIKSALTIPKEKETYTLTTDLAFDANSTLLSRSALKQIIKQNNGKLKDSSLDWTLHSLLTNGVIERVARGKYRAGSGLPARSYAADLSSEARAILTHVKDRYPQLEFLVWELRAYNEFINHQIARNTVFVEVERSLEEFVFEELRSWADYPVLLRPTNKEVDAYSGDTTAIVLRLISEAPAKDNQPLLEKLLVDLVANKLLRNMISPNEFEGAFVVAAEHYQLNISTMLRYARRRGQEKEIRSLVGSLGKYQAIGESDD